MAQIIIADLERDEQPISDIWAVISLISENSKNHALDIEFQLELVLEDWDENKLESLQYIQTIKKWKKIAENNKFEFINQVES